MKIERKFQLSIATNRRFILRQASTGKKIACAECGEPMVTTEQAAGLFEIKQRRIFQIIENEAVHFNDNEVGGVMICLSSLAVILDGESQENQILKTNKTAAR